MKSVNNFKEFKKLILKDKDELPDSRTGMTPVLLEINYLSKLSLHQPYKKKYEKWLSKLPYFLNEFNQKDIGNLSFFIYAGEFKGSKKICESYTSWLRQADRIENNIYKSAALMRLVSYLGHHFSKGDVALENLVKKNYAWDWIDSMVFDKKDPNFIKWPVLNELTKQEGFENLYRRIRYWNSKFFKNNSLKKVLQEWKKILPEDKQKLLDAELLN